MRLPSGLASISSQFDDTPNVRGAVAFGRTAAKRREMNEALDAWLVNATLPKSYEIAAALGLERACAEWAREPGVIVRDHLSSAIDRHAQLAISAGYRSADRR